jgi:hypothetical protein
MKKSSKEWVDSIRVTQHQKGKDHWFTADCPICEHSQDATVHGNGSSSAETAAKLKIAAHIRLEHTDCLTPEKTEIEKEGEELKKEIFGDPDKPA